MQPEILESLLCDIQHGHYTDPQARELLRTVGKRFRRLQVDRSKAADIVGVSVRTIDRWRATGALRTIRPGGSERAQPRFCINDLYKCAGCPVSA